MSQVINVLFVEGGITYCCRMTFDSVTTSAFTFEGNMHIHANEVPSIVIQNSRPASSVLLAPHPRCCREAAGPFQSVEGRD